MSWCVMPEVLYVWSFSSSVRDDGTYLCRLGLYEAVFRWLSDTKAQLPVMGGVHVAAPALNRSFLKEHLEQPVLLADFVHSQFPWPQITKLIVAEAGNWHNTIVISVY